MAAKKKATTQKIIGIHLDLKGKMFKPSYIPQLLKDLASQGINTVLVEYEDIFPFKGIDVAWDESVTWSKRTLQRFLKEAEANRIEVIPLQQCLGHLEYVYRWPQYRSMAEDAAYPSTLCLSNREGKELIFTMLRQVLEAHPQSRFVHLGMDEARNLAGCKRCASKGGVLNAFLEHLRDLCDIVEEYGKTPVIWSDMLEDHFRADVMAEFKDRVIMCPWDYGSSGSTVTRIRYQGWRMSRKWLSEPDNPEAPPVAAGQKFVEDLSPAQRKRLAPYRRGDREFQTLFQADLWTALGFRVIGASAVRVSADKEVLPDYPLRMGNIKAWARAIKRTKQMGLIGTSWARGNTFCPPNFSIDLTWPCVNLLAREMGAKPKRFWNNLSHKQVETLALQLGRCQKDWTFEEDLIARMESLSGGMKTHEFEWQSLVLMARTLHWQRQAKFAALEVDSFLCDCRLVEPEWKRRIKAQRNLLNELKGLRRDVTKHFGERYEGDAFKEWIRHMFGGDEANLRSCLEVARTKLAEAKEVFGEESSP